MNDSASAISAPEENFLRRFAAIASNTREQGDLFEKLIQEWLLNAPPHKDRFRKVSLWREWAAARNGDRGDIGVDLVAETFDGEYCAIQCKFYDPTSTLPLGNISNFTTALSSTFFGEEFTSGLLIATTRKLSSKIESAIKGLPKPCSIVDFVHELSCLKIDWDEVMAQLPDDSNAAPIIKGIQEKIQIGEKYARIVDLPALLKKIIPQPSSQVKKQPLPHQTIAIEKVLAGFQNAERGKLIMACGTGKTFTALKIAERFLEKQTGVEKQTGAEKQTGTGNILFLVPSLSLLSQAMHEWSRESTHPLRNFAVCSDSKVGRNNDDISVHDLAIPATTNASRLAAKLKQKTERINVVFSTYHSIEVVAEAQKHGAPAFDLIICDEAHRTTGVDDSAVSGQRESYFTSVHDGEYIRASRRLYMTATPRLYTAAAKSKANEYEYKIYSMDDAAQYGEEFYRFNFSEAVDAKQLSDYKVIVVTLKEDSKTADKLKEYHKVSLGTQTGRGKKYEVSAEDLVKIIGCWKGLAKQTDNPVMQGDDRPMRRAVAFTSTINRSKVLTELFPRVMHDYQQNNAPADSLDCELQHVDGTQNTLERNKKLDWLKREPEENHCRILSNVRCLSEGVDVPALDAVLFLNPRKSEVDIVQSVGRVMRKSEGKKYGYIILPIITPADEPAEAALNENDTYRVIWQVLCALRSHDSRLDIEINQLGLSKKDSERIIVIDGDADPDGNGDGKDASGDSEQILRQTPIDFSGWEDAIFAHIVKYCGDRQYWDTWAGEVATISKSVTERITKLSDEDEKIKTEFGRFVRGLQENINPAVDESAALEMLSQHIITRPIFDALFGGDSFVAANPVSKTMQAMLTKLDDQDLLTTATAGLEVFYESVRQTVGRKIQGIDDTGGRQQIIIELYEKFFKKGFPKMQESLGIVYTPMEVVDFIIRSVDDLLKKEFGKGITAKQVNLLDPFTGTGTFITRLLQSDAITTEDLPRKYKAEIHANEIVLLAYYIAAINIEQAYQQRLTDAGQKNTAYAPFEGIALTDTFQINEGDDDSPQAGLLPKILPINAARIERQKQTPITVVFGNPPYSVGQGSQNDDNQNLKYKKLDASIAESYAKHSTATNKNSLYDSYIRAIRWASDRIGDEGVVAFVSNGGYIDGNAMDGLRKCLADDFSSVYCFNLRGNARTSGEQRRKEKSNIFGEGTRTPVAILLLVKKPKAASDTCQIFYHDIGDYLDRKQKLKIIADFATVKKIPWQTITPDKNHDWLNQQNEAFASYLPLGDRANKKQNGKKNSSVFSSFGRGVETCRDAWVYNFSKQTVAKNMQSTIAFYNRELDRYQAAGKSESVNFFVDKDATKISWSSSLENKFSRGIAGDYRAQNIRAGIYRPFTKQHLYFDNVFIHRPAIANRYFPTATADNLAICVSGIGAGKDFSALMADCVPNLHFLDTSQCFPRHTYLENQNGNHTKIDNIPAASVTLFQKHYDDSTINGDAIFCYVYGILHNADYKTKFAADLKKTLPRIPFAKTVADFRAFAQAGKKLGELHTGYENVAPWPLKIIEENAQPDNPNYYRVEKAVKIKYASKTDKSKIIYNHNIRLENIPPEVQEYTVNGKPALDWIIDRYQVKTDKDSQLDNDPNQWSEDPKYILDLICKVVRVSVETVKIVKGLPALDLE